MTDPLDDLVTTPQGPFFRFPDEATGMAALEAAGLLNEDGEFITASHSHALDVLGTISRGGEWVVKEQQKEINNLKEKLK